MKGILKFDLSDPDDKIAFDRANKALELSLAILNHFTFMHDKIKYETLSKKEHALIEILGENLVEQLNHYNINLDELVR